MRYMNQSSPSHELFAIEGDFIETRNHMIFDVNGINQPKDRIIAFLRYVPLGFFIDGIGHYLESVPDHWTGERKGGFVKFKEKVFSLIQNDNISEIKPLFQQYTGFEIDDVRTRFFTNNSSPPNRIDSIYVKIYSIAARYEILSKIKPEYIVRFRNYDFPLQSVLKNDIIHVFTPESHLSEMLREGANHDAENNNKKYFESIIYLLTFLSNGAKIPLSTFGLSGSAMVNLITHYSDYDLVVYGKKNVQKLRRFLAECFKTNFTTPHNENTLLNTSQTTHVIQKYDHDQLVKHYKVRAKGFQFALEDFIKCEQRKTHQFSIDGVSVFIRYLKESRNQYHLNNDFDSIMYEDVGRVTLKGTIIEDEDNYYTPAFYSMKPDELVDSHVNNYPSDEKQIINKKDELMEKFIQLIKTSDLEKLEIFTIRGRFMEQASNGDHIIISGKLEYCINLNPHGLTKTQNYFHVVVGIDANDIFYPI
jgi:predicted nucleotidyltransferase